MLGMHLLQCTHRPSSASPVSKRSPAGSGRGAGPGRWPPSRSPRRLARSMVSARLMPPSRMRGIDERVAELACHGQHVRLLERVRLEEQPSGEPEAGRDHLRHGDGHLVEGYVATEQVHRVLQRAAAGELEGIEVTVVLEQTCHLQRVLQPQPAAYPVVHVQLRGDRHRVRGPRPGLRPRSPGRAGRVARRCHPTRRCAC